MSDYYRKAVNEAAVMHRDAWLRLLEGKYGLPKPSALAAFHEWIALGMLVQVVENDDGATDT